MWTLWQNHGSTKSSLGNSTSTDPTFVSAAKSGTMVTAGASMLYVKKLVFVTLDRGNYISWNAQDMAALHGAKLLNFVEGDINHSMLCSLLDRIRSSLVGFLPPYPLPSCLRWQFSPHWLRHGRHCLQCFHWTRPHKSFFFAGNFCLWKKERCPWSHTVLIFKKYWTISSLWEKLWRNQRLSSLSSEDWGRITLPLSHHYARVSTMPWCLWFFKWSSWIKKWMDQCLSWIPLFRPILWPFPIFQILSIDLKGNLWSKRSWCHQVLQQVQRSSISSYTQ